MSHCVLRAFEEHLTALRVRPDNYLSGLYYTLKGEVQNVNEFTDGAWVPFLAQRVARHYGLRLTVEHAIWTPEAYLAVERRALMVRLIQWGEWGAWVPEVTLRPAVYLSLATLHAYYGPAPTDGWSVLALQFDEEA